MSLRNYILNEKGEPVVEPDVYKWGKWFEEPNHRIVKQDTVLSVNGKEYFVSTVFLAMDYSFNFTGRDREPILYETMIFCDAGDDTLDYQERYRNREEALVGHEKAVEFAKNIK